MVCEAPPRSRTPEIAFAFISVENGLVAPAAPSSANSAPLATVTGKPEKPACATLAVWAPDWTVTLVMRTSPQS